MPNWCSNNLTLSHDDPVMIQRVVRAADNGGLFQEFVPCPEPLLNTTAGSHSDADQQAQLEILEDANLHAYGARNWYDWCVSNWGTKWDTSDPFVSSKDTNTISLSFDTAWSPPVLFYQRMEELGFEVHATYYESGMSFVGRYCNGDDECFEFNEETADTVRKVIGDELDDEYGISESMREWEQEEQQE
jgi:hypothetical protein